MVMAPCYAGCVQVAEWVRVGSPADENDTIPQRPKSPRDGPNELEVGGAGVHDASSSWSRRSASVRSRARPIRIASSSARPA